MTSERDEPLRPDTAAEWTEWGKRQGNRWGAQAKTWRSEAWSWSHPEQQAPQSALRKAIWTVIGLPAAIIGVALVLALVVAALAAALLVGSMLLWLGMGVGSAAFASRRGWPSQIGGLLGFALGPIGLLLVRRLPQRR